MIKLPVPNIIINANDQGAVFQDKINASLEAIRNAIIAYNSQIDAAQTAMQYTEPASQSVALAGENNTFKMTPLRVKQAIESFRPLTTSPTDTTQGRLWRTNDLVKTTSATDSTNGRMLKVGDAGILTANKGVRQLTNAGALTPQEIEAAVGGIGSYELISLVGGVLDFGEGFAPQRYGRIKGFTASTNNYQYSWQEYTGTNGNRKWQRRAFSATVWGPWQEIYHQGSILGTVSQLNGIPTGALIQRGTNANGEFVRFADGTLICTGTTAVTSNIDIAFEGGVRSGGLTQVFPSAFVNQEYRISMTPTARANNAPFSMGHQLSGSPGSFGFQLHAITPQASKTYQFDWVAFGRWF
ncbi:pyocin knob domain-containing protein [Alishewanella jeotgali]|uniref:Tail fiber protein n=1 Tax=Alishewanella jeotgali KCTC 22429 TaxID=1129374 RepID=H3Z9P1_9ALTE|nr:pyocin knob domain-containing protein [Alishewanella jeotgali]EHR42742.1 hypothetical protein AJE_00210 [Alishewanella jeotgali KCTC 22429]